MGISSTELIIIFILFALLVVILPVIIYLNVKNRRKPRSLPSSPQTAYLAESKLENLDYLRSRNLISAAEYNKKREKIINEI